jgi:hypothetical protein
MFHWTDSKIQVHAFYGALALLLTSQLQRELARQGEPLSIDRRLEELGGIRETLCRSLPCPRADAASVLPASVSPIPLDPYSPRVTPGS